VKDFLNDFTKLPSWFQKVFSMQMRSAVGIMIRYEKVIQAKRDLADQ
jgi:hypothetical protein